MITNVRDVTELYELKDQLRQNEKLSAKNVSELEAMRRQIIGDGELVVHDPVMLSVMHMIDRVSRLDTTVLLTGKPERVKTGLLPIFTGTAAAARNGLSK